ncbi:MAG: zinc ribbon domain-containing protein [Acidobacteria bacterium]|nr:zinc ribbon domain-containing protein [Acidobacteriota bacterium]MBI3279865.1 zinc ribbon domain-containing protein [Acidobacteriota bacterium]
MSRLRQELKIIPLAAWIIAVLMYLGFVLLSSRVLIPRDPELSPWPVLAKILFSFGIPMILAVLVLVIGYVYADAKRRGMRYVLWTLLAIFIPNAIGIILYFILRDPLPQPCPKCGATVLVRFPYCPACGTAVAQTCPECRRRVEPGWSHCAHCGASLRSERIPVGQTEGRGQ